MLIFACWNHIIKLYYVNYCRFWTRREHNRRSSNERINDKNFDYNQGSSTIKILNCVWIKYFPNCCDILFVVWVTGWSCIYSKYCVFYIVIKIKNYHLLFQIMHFLFYRTMFNYAIYRFFVHNIALLTSKLISAQIGINSLFGFRSF